MASKSHSYSRRRLAKLVLSLLLLILLIPEILIGTGAVLAGIKGCQLDQNDVCLLAGFPLSQFIAMGLQTGAGLIVAVVRRSDNGFLAFYVAIATWFIACGAAVILGWSTMTARLLLGLGVALVFAVIPYFGPMIAVEALANKNCRPNEGNVGSCVIFGGDVGEAAHDAISLGWLALGGLPLALVLFLLFAILVVILRVVAAKRPAILTS